MKETYVEKLYREAENRAAEKALLCDHCGKLPWRGEYLLQFSRVAARALARTEKRYLCDECVEKIKQTIRDNRQADGVREKDQIEPIGISLV